MSKNKLYFRDRTALLLLSISLFLTIANSALIILRMTAVRGSSNYIVSYRANLGHDHYTQGSVWDIMGFVLAGLMIFGFSAILSYRVYGIRQALSKVVLALSAFLLVLLIIVSNALLVLR
ncbi:hypothetical protein KBC77_03400 [Candidatus Saccharibacteria bacterium]|nr:hypothetical protein [Candidatus Saccharibacteria bacterium]